jgi:hypothetical protein
MGGLFLYRAGTFQKVTAVETAWGARFSQGKNFGGSCIYLPARHSLDWETK